ncbi:hypothetical protein LTR05_006538 [Lithohypha guttulata]|uniref:ADP-ribosylation factor GTPase-activating protein n=1 Tax=Lithohypha guttulata TaxID=1690604 RepID=A0AAN7YEE1_9EURO|nr:hypothetical protein LTR05_006538 [Lithohypha guttulata]
MGNISSRQDDLSGSMLYLKDPTRFSVKSVTISNGRKKVLLRVGPNAVPTTRMVARREPGDDTPIFYIQDPESQGNNFLLRLDLEDELHFEYTFVSRQQTSTQPATTPSAAPSTTDTNITGLTFAYASNARELDTLITREFHSDPNLHKNSNVQLIGAMSTTGLPSVEMSWTWTWRPPKPNEDRGGGWRNNCSFLEYDSRAHRLNTLASFVFWVQKPSLPPAPSIMPPPVPNLNELAIPSGRHRMPSSQSYQSAVSDSEGPPDTGPPVSPSGHASELSLSVATAPTLPAVDVGRPAEDMSNVEDGPVFRANMKQLEQKTGNLRAQVKKVLKRAEAAQQAQQLSNEAVRSFLSALQEAAASHSTAFKPALEHYYSNIAPRIQRYEEENTVLLRRQIIEPLSKLYTNDIKQVESKKKDFEEESREYYAYVGRYLGQRQDSMKEKKKAESDSKYQTKKRTFELKRFDYSNFMQDLHGGKKEQELLSHLTNYADHQAKAYMSAARKIEALQPNLDALVREVNEADKEYKIQRTEREEKRRNLEMNNPTSTTSEADGTPYAGAVQPQTSASNGTAGYVSDTDLSRADSTSSQFGRNNLSPSNSKHLQQTSTALSTSPAASSATPSANKFRGIRDLEERDSSFAGNDKQSTCAPRKEGLLWALSKPGSHIDPKGINKQAWHKFWVVLDQGKLSEYSNWKDRMELHREPIDLRMASVRMARDAERRFCFEVITPQYKRVYQATAEDDMNNWINSINNALQSAFEGRTSQSAIANSPKDRAGNDYGAVLTGKSLSQSGPHGALGRPDTVGVSRRVTVGSRPAPTQTQQEESPTRLLDQIRANDQGNACCADCGSNSKVEWVSLNLGIVLCIECGGIHRSLGTHVSKIRSLTLDVHSLTDDIVEILMQIGNRVSNMIWEATLERSAKPEPWANREQRLKFITMKYVERAFVEPHTSNLHALSPDDNLVMSIKKNDIQGVLHAIAQRANVNVHDRSRNTHAVFLALAAADPARPASTSPAASPGGPTTMQAGTKVFPVAELLIQNGAEIPTELPAIPLSLTAQSYIDQRRSRSMPVTDTLGPLPAVAGSKSVEQVKLHKRGSAGSRFAGKVAGLGER